MLRDEVEKTLAAMTWLKPADAAMQALALHLAGQIDTARARAEEFGELDGTFERDEPGYDRLRRLEAWCDVAKAVGLLGPKLRDVLKDLGGTPGSRLNFEGADPDEGIAGRVSTLRGGLLMIEGQNAG